MRRFAALLVALIPLAFASADDAKDKAVKAELEKLKGKWKNVSTEFAGKATVLPPYLVGVTTIDGMKWTVEGAKRTVVWSVSIDPTQNPKTLDRTIKGKDATEKDVVDKCIYKVDGDTLTICSGRTPRPGGAKADVTPERPKEFKTTDGGSIIVLKRVKE